MQNLFRKSVFQIAGELLVTYDAAVSLKIAAKNNPIRTCFHVGHDHFDLPGLLWRPFWAATLCVCFYPHGFYRFFGQHIFQKFVVFLLKPIDCGGYYTPLTVSLFKTMSLYMQMLLLVVWNTILPQLMIGYLLKVAIPPVVKFTQRGECIR